MADVRKETDSLGFDDLLPMAKLLDEAHTWIGEQLKAVAKRRRDADAEDSGEEAA